MSCLIVWTMTLVIGKDSWYRHGLMVYTWNHCIESVILIIQVQDGRVLPVCNWRRKNSAYGQHSALSYVCDSGAPIWYHESKSIPSVLSIPWVHVYTMSPCQFHEPLSIRWVHVYTISPCQIQEVAKGPSGTKGPRGSKRSMRYLMVQEVPKGPSGT